MNLLHRLLLAVALAVWIAVPIVGITGGENGGGTGVWVLPRATFFSSGVGPAPGVAPRQILAFANANQDIRLAVSAEVNTTAVATLVDPISAVPTPLAVIGSEVVIPASLQQALVSSNCLVSTIVIVDANQYGYFIQLVVLPGTGGFELRIY